MKLKLLAIGALTVGALLTTAQADTVNGILWRVNDATAGNAVIGSIPGFPGPDTPNITFTISSGPFSFFASGNGQPSYTEAAWLASAGAQNINELIAGSLAAQMDDGTIGTLMTLAGTATVATGQKFTFTHDDGMSLYLFVNNVWTQVAGFTSGPTAQVTETGTWNGAPGNYQYLLVYGETALNPAVLNGVLPGVVVPGTPDGGTTVGLLGMALAGLAGLGRRIRAR